jgi:DNA polymerase-3 subunit delta'
VVHNGLDIATFYRDVMMVQAGSPDALINKEVEAEINAVAAKTKPQNTIKKINAIIVAAPTWATTQPHC